MSASKLNAAFARALANGRGMDADPNSYSFIFMANALIEGQSFPGATINNISDTIYTARAGRAGVEAMLKDDRITAMELSRILFSI